MSSESQSIEVTEPKEFKHLVHMGSDFKWTFDETTKPESIFQKVMAVGKGGFGSVFQILHIPSSTLLAGKIITPELMTKATRDSLNREINIMKQITTPYTVQYYGSINYEGSLMILMEFCDRGSLRDIMDFKNQNLSENQISIIMSDVLNGLMLLHDKYQTIHRDIKAGNILLNSKGQIRVTDFGVSRKFDKTSTMTTTMTVGSPYWMPPEVISGQKYSFPADIWSVGATAIELAEGKPPLFEFPPTRAMIEIATNGFPGFREGSAFTQEFQDFCRACMTVNPAERPTIPQLLQSPFIQRAKSLNRNDIMKPLTETRVDFKVLMKNNEEEDASEPNDISETTTEPPKKNSIHNKPSGEVKKEDLYKKDATVVSSPVEQSPTIMEPVKEKVQQVKGLWKDHKNEMIGAAVALALVMLKIFGVKGFIVVVIMIGSLLYYFREQLGL